MSVGLIQVQARKHGGRVTLPPHPPSFSAQRILIVSHAADIGGAEHGLIDLACHLGPGRCEVLLLADGALRTTLEQLGVRVRMLPARHSLLGVRRAGSALRALASVPDAVKLALQLAAVARGHRLIYANSQKAALLAMLAGAIARRPVIWHLHDILSPDHFSTLQRCGLARLSTHLTHAVIVVSEAARKTFVASGGNPDRVRLIHNGIDPAPYTELAALDRTALRATLCLPQGPLVGLFGRITEWKGQRVLIQALRDLPDVQALIVGSPMFGQQAEEVYLHDLARRLGVACRVHFLGQRTDTPRLMRAVDLVVHCSTAPEPFGRVIVEALFAGTPVLAAEGGACREILGDTDWAVEPGNPVSLAAAITRILAEGDKLHARKLADLRARVQSLFSLEQMLRALEGVIAGAA